MSSEKDVRKALESPAAVEMNSEQERAFFLHREAQKAGSQQALEAMLREQDRVDLESLKAAKDPEAMPEHVAAGSQQAIDKVTRELKEESNALAEIARLTQLLQITHEVIKNMGMVLSQIEGLASDLMADNQELRKQIANPRIHSEPGA